MAKMQRHASEDSPYPKGQRASWIRGMGAQEVAQKAAPSKVEGVQEKLVGEEWKEEEEVA